MESGFFAVWDRVTGANPAADELTRLRRWILDEAQGLQACEGLLRLASANHIRETLRQILSAKRRQVKSLQAIYFLRTGDLCVIEHKSGSGPTSFLQGLREQYAMELAQAESYRRSTSGPDDLNELCAALFAEKKKTAGRLKGLLERLL